MWILCREDQSEEVKFQSTVHSVGEAFLFKS